jgi:hypothetical protein
MNRSQPPPHEYLEAIGPDDRWWLPWAPRTQFLRQVRAIWRDITNLRSDMASAAEYAARVDAATNELASDLSAIRDRLAAVEQASEADKQAAVDAALAELDGPISRLESLGRDDAPAEPESPAEPSDGGFPSDAA